jgi:putative phage-type endonuclease
MSATLVLPGTAAEADWLDARRKGVTASEIAPLMGLSNWTSPYALFHRKLGNLPEQEDNLSMVVGRHFEGFVADLFYERHPEFTALGNGQELYAHPDRPWQMATPDRLLYPECYPPWLPDIADVLAVLECKTSSSYDEWGEDGSDDIPVKYRCQVLWQCDVLGVGAWFVACLFMHSRKLRVYHGEVDDQARADLDLMRAEAEIFLRMVQRGDEPPVDWRPATGDALKALHPDLEDRTAVVTLTLASQYRRACAAYKRAEQRKKLADHKLRHAAGNAARISDKRGDAVAQHQIYPVREHVRKASVVDKLVPAKTKEQPK